MIKCLQQLSRIVIKKEVLDMSKIETVAKMKKATDLTKLAFRKNGPKSFKAGVGALVIALSKAGGSMTQRELTEVLGMGRKGVKTIVKKAMKSDLVVIENTDEKKVYNVVLTDEGKKVAAKRIAADEAVADAVLATLTDEELAQLDAISDKIILAVKDMGIKGKKKHAYKHSHRCKKHGRRGMRHGKRFHD